MELDFSHSFGLHKLAGVVIKHRLQLSWNIVIT